MMRIAILGTDRDVVTIIAAACEAGHEIVWLGDVRPIDREAIQQSLSDGEIQADWEVLLDHGFVDAVVAGRGAMQLDEQIDRIKRLTAETIPLLVVFPLGAGILPTYELDMLRREHAAPLLHFNPLRSGPFAEELSHLVATGHKALGTIHQIHCDRTISDMGRECVLAWLARDIELLREIVGDFAKVSAMGPPADAAQFAALQVQMNGPGETAIHWRVAPTSSAGRLKATFVGERGMLVLNVPQGDGLTTDWSLTFSVEGRDSSEEVETHAAANMALSQLEQTAVEGGDASTWESATQAMEVVDAVELSLQKGRTIDVHHQVLTEHVAFKGVMSALGCGLLVLGFLILLAVGALGDIMGLAIFKVWPIAALVLLLAFLLLQAIPWLAAKTKGDGRREDHSAD